MKGRITPMVNYELVQKAKEALIKAYAPYSKFFVGAAVLAKSGKIYTGCNIENAAYSETCCAERVAIFKAISEGDVHFREMAIIANTKHPITPCGACRQVMAEFMSENMKIFLANKEGKVTKVKLKDLLPGAFTEDFLT